MNTVSQGTASNDDKFSNNEIRTVNSGSDFPYPLDVVLSLPEPSYLSTNAEGNPVSPSGAGNANTSVDILAKALELSGIEEEETLDTSLPAIEQDTQAHTSDSCVSTPWASGNPKEIAEGMEWGEGKQNEISSKFGLSASKSADQIHPCKSGVRNPFIFQSMEAKVNIPGLTTRQLQNKVQQARFEKSSGIQNKILDKLAEKCPGGRFSIKADVCDVNKGLRESLKHVWSGDSDLGDGSLQKLYDLYMERRNFYGKLGLGERRGKILTDLAESLKKLEDDMLFLKNGEEESRQIYNRRLDARNASQESSFSLAWEVEGYRRLLVSANELKDRMNKMLCVYGLPVSERGNIPQELSVLRKDLLAYVQHLFIKHRDAASHLLIFMVSD